MEAGELEDPWAEPGAAAPVGPDKYAGQQRVYTVARDGAAYVWEYDVPVPEGSAWEKTLAIAVEETEVKSIFTIHAPHTLDFYGWEAPLPLEEYMRIHYEELKSNETLLYINKLETERERYPLRCM